MSMHLQVLICRYFFVIAQTLIKCYVRPSFPDCIVLIHIHLSHLIHFHNSNVISMRKSDLILIFCISLQESHHSTPTVNNVSSSSNSSKSGAATSYRGEIGPCSSTDLPPLGQSFVSIFNFVTGTHRKCHGSIIDNWI